MTIKSSVFSMLYYEARVVFGIATLIPLVLLPGYMVLGWLIWTSRNAVPPIDQIIPIFELLLTLGAGLSCAHLMSIEREENFDILRRSYPEQSWRLAVMRAVYAAALIIVSGLLAALIFYIINGNYSFQQAFLPAFVPALYLGMVAMLINNLTGNYWASAGAIIIYWYAEFATNGYYTENLYLFNHAMPNPALDPSLNRGLLLIGALVCVGVNVGYSLWRRQRSA